MKLLPCGETAFLIELPDADTRRSVHAELITHPVDGVIECVPAALTVLIAVARPSDLPFVADHVRQIALRVEMAGSTSTSDVRRDDVLEIPVRYDGEDLEFVANHLDITRDEVVRRHCGQLWRVDFAGFMPGFGYLTGENGGLTVPRRTSPRTRIPAGSVALAGDYTGLYPQASPGGWQLIGMTQVELWNTHRTPPALLIPGRLVRFVPID